MKYSLMFNKFMIQDSIQISIKHFKINSRTNHPMLRHLGRHFSAASRRPRPSPLTSFVQHYQSNGHQIASNIDPLGRANPIDSCGDIRHTFDAEYWGLSEVEWLQTF